MATFGDMMSLLLCFFILMFSMSEVKVEKYLIAAESLRSGLGHGLSREKLSAGSGGHSIVETDVLTSDAALVIIPAEDIDDFLEMLRQRLETFIAENQLHESVEVKKDESGVTLAIRDILLFDEGSAELRGDGRRVIDELGMVMAELDTPVVVAGHTDDKPINTRVFPSNWELSSARAATVTRLILSQGLDPGKIHVEGHAEFSPASSNETAEGRAKNRRVEIRYRAADIASQLREGRGAAQPPPDVAPADVPPPESGGVGSPGSQGAPQPPPL
jgi:chemotaxis protein MotB